MFHGRRVWVEDEKEKVKGEKKIQDNNRSRVKQTCHRVKMTECRVKIKDFGRLRKNPKGRETHNLKIFFEGWKHI